MLTPAFHMSPFKSRKQRRCEAELDFGLLYNVQQRIDFAN